MIIFRKIKIKKYAIYIFFIVFLFSPFSISFVRNGTERDSEILHISSTDPIYINGNWSEAVSKGIASGEGTYSSPYIIQDKIINGGEYGILIENSIKVFEIRNCTIINSTISGVKLENVSYFEIRNCSIYSLKHYSNGVFLQRAKNGAIIDNKIESEGTAIYYESLGDKEPDNNTITDNMIHSDNYGIKLGESFNNTLERNKLEGCSIFTLVEGNQISLSNKVNGDSVRHYENEDKISLLGEEDVGQIILINTNNSVIQDCNVLKGTTSLTLSNSFNNTIRGNNFSQNKGYGMDLYNSNNNSIQSNVYSENAGVLINGSSSNLFSNNEVVESPNGVGLFLMNAMLNDVKGNNFSSNRFWGILGLSVIENTLLDHKMASIFLEWIPQK